MNKVYALLKDLVDRDPEFDYRRHYVRLSDCADAGALLYVREKLAALKRELDGE